MKISIKYKTDGYSYPQKNLDTDKMYAWNGYVFRQFESLQELLVCMEQNKPIMVLSENVGDHIKNDDVDKYVEFVINPSAIAIVFPDRSYKTVIEEGKKIDKESGLEIKIGPEVSALVDTYIGSTNKDGITD